MNHKLRDKIADLYFSEAASEAELNGFKISEKQMAAFRFVYSLGIRDGRDSMFTELKNIYDHDPDELVIILEDPIFDEVDYEEEPEEDIG